MQLYYIEQYNVHEHYCYFKLDSNCSIGYFIIRDDINMRQRYDRTKVKPRFHKQLFTKDSPYGHKIQRDKTKTIPRKAKYKQINTPEEEE